MLIIKTRFTHSKTKLTFFRFLDQLRPDSSDATMLLVTPSAKMSSEQPNTSRTLFRLHARSWQTNYTLILTCLWNRYNPQPLNRKIQQQNHCTYHDELTPMQFVTNMNDSDMKTIDSKWKKGKPEKLQFSLAINYISQVSVFSEDLFLNHHWYS